MIAGTISEPRAAFLRRHPRKIAIAGGLVVVAGVLLASVVAAIAGGVVWLAGCVLWLGDARYQAALDAEYERMMLDLRD
jgi:CHASE2 domain-containing sensor protein